MDGEAVRTLRSCGDDPASELSTPAPWNLSRESVARDEAFTP